MKKKFLSLVAAVLAFCLSASLFTGCDLVTVDNQKDMNLVVAEVSIGDDAPTEKIYKKDLIVLYMNYGYYYVQSYGYTMKQAFELLMNNLVNNVLLVQNAVEYFAEKQNVTSDKYNLEQYLDEDEITEAKYLTVKSFNDLIESYKETEDDEKETETATGDVRTVPTDATNYAEEYEGIDKFWEEYSVDHPGATEDEKETKYFEDYIEKGIITGFDANFNTTDLETKRAYEKVLKALDVNSLIGSDFDYKKGSIYDTDYYKDTLENQYETVLLEKYEKELKKDILSKVSYDDLSNRYVELYNAQKEKSATDYDTLLSEASATSPILYHKEGLKDYGYVYNLLLGINDTQSSQITALQSAKTEKNLTDADYAKYRSQILSATTVKDLRSSWITSGYDFDYATKTFTGDYAIAKNTLAFNGEVKWLNESEKDNEDYEAKYSAESNVLTVNDFVEYMDEYLYGSRQTGVDSSSWYKKVSATSKPADFEDKINELLFAYSTDSGSLNTYKGYLVKSEVVIGASETYVKEFAKAAREVINMADGSYIIVETDYGYHIIFKSQNIGSTTNYETLDGYLDANWASIKKSGTWAEYYAEMIKDIDAWSEDNDTNFYLYQLQQSYCADVLDSKLSELQNEIICKYKEYDEENKEYGDYDSKYVKIYKNRYSEYLIED